MRVGWGRIMSKGGLWSSRGYGGRVAVMGGYIHVHGLVADPASCYGGY